MDIKKEAESVIVTPIDNMNVINANDYRNIFNQLIIEGSRNIVIDFSNTNCIDARAVGIIIKTYNTLRELGGTLIITNVKNSKILRVLEICQVNRVLPIQ